MPTGTPGQRNLPGHSRKVGYMEFLAASFSPKQAVYMALAIGKLEGQPLLVLTRPARLASSSAETGPSLAQSSSEESATRQLVLSSHACPLQHFVADTILQTALCESLTQCEAERIARTTPLWNERQLPGSDRFWLICWTRKWFKCSRMQAMLMCGLDVFGRSAVTRGG